MDASRAAPGDRDGRRRRRQRAGRNAEVLRGRSHRPDRRLTGCLRRAGARHQSPVRHDRELRGLAGRPHARRPCAEPEHGGRGSGFELVDQPVGQTCRVSGRAVEGPRHRQWAGRGAWTVIAAKNDGITPGFTVRDSSGQVWFLKFDPPGYRAMSTGTEVVVANLFWALGYYVPEVHLAALRPDQLAMTTRHASRRRAAAAAASSNRISRRCSARRIATPMARIASSPARRSRAGLSAVSGSTAHAPTTPTTPCRTSIGESSAAYGTYSAWVNHVDSKSINTLDTVVTVGGRTSCGTTCSTSARRSAAPASIRGKRSRGGNTSSKGGKTLAGHPDVWVLHQELAHVPLYRESWVGAFPDRPHKVGSADVEATVANPSFRSARLDVLGTARRLQGFTVEMLKAVTRVGQFNDAPRPRCSPSS